MSEQFTEEQQNQLLFMMLVKQNQQIARAGMGQEEHPATGKVEMDLKSARFAIDTLHMLQKYTEGNLNQELSEFLDQTLKELKLGYQQADSEDPPTGNGSTETGDHPG